jgi:DNA invertase Pin-like site-specific DNA recombinase
MSLRAFCRDLRLEVVVTHTDFGSGFKRSRAGLRQALREAEEGRFDVVVVQQVDRLSRRREDVASIIETLGGNGVAVVSTDKNLDTRYLEGSTVLRPSGGHRSRRGEGG